VANAGTPATSGEINGIISGTTKKPLVRLVASGTQSINNNAATALAFATEDYDTNGFHDTVTNNTRITPNKAGYYRLTGSVLVGSRTDWTFIQVGINKNGTAVPPHNRVGPNANGTVRAVDVDVTQQANGTTDYFELVVLQVNAAAVAVATNQSSQFSSVFECEFIREL
jgi:hypothetical protein